MYYKFKFWIEKCFETIAFFCQIIMYVYNTWVLATRNINLLNILKRNGRGGVGVISSIKLSGESLMNFGVMSRKISLC